MKGPVKRQAECCHHDICTSGQGLSCLVISLLRLGLLGNCRPHVAWAWSCIPPIPCGPRKGQDLLTSRYLKVPKVMG